MKIRQIGIRLGMSVRGAVKPAVKNILWLLKLMLPITLGIAVAQYLGIIAVISDALTPLMATIGLDGSASLVFISSVFANIYTAIGVMAGLHLDFRSVTILASMCLIAHNMIIETLIQKKTGSSAIYMILLRIGASLLAAFCLHMILPQHFSGQLHLGVPPQVPASWGEVFTNWFMTLGPLILKVVGIVGSLQILQNILREFQLIDLLTLPLRPLVVAMGMKPKVTFLWIVANTLGLGYGGAVLYSEVQQGQLNREEVDGLNTSIAVTHSLLEDTTLFAVVGVPVFLLILPRMILSVLVLWAERLIRLKVPVLAYHKNSR